VGGGGGGVGGGLGRGGKELRYGWGGVSIMLRGHGGESGTGGGEGVDVASGGIGGCPWVGRGEGERELQLVASSEFGRKALCSRLGGAGDRQPFI